MFFWPEKPFAPFGLNETSVLTEIGRAEFCQTLSSQIG